MTSLANEKIGNASGLFKLPRNVGGNIGISIVNTLITRYEQIHCALVVKDVAPGRLPFQRTFSSLSNMMMQNGADPVLAANRAYELIRNKIEAQATILSYNRRLPIFGLGVFRMRCDGSVPESVRGRRRVERLWRTSVTMELAAAAR